ncbi:hypothetical protein TRP8649_03360 [Pelagimonas phthalicica]|uniref:Uncharacterized protein n=1 Tax=Pelagimonas phthalicica TaxID=1037362 RepID=A0A238JGG0_9RHOB|nr:hypothetical protein [Pelagimonas phthalicica]SMX29227.1 hypothetical protein TRP8649_03360 [Pelagimonas phthalicica]
MATRPAASPGFVRKISSRGWSTFRRLVQEQARHMLPGFRSQAKRDLLANSEELDFDVIQDDLVLEHILLDRDIFA